MTGATHPKQPLEGLTIRSGSKPRLLRKPLLNVTELRGPPTVGERYLVPSVRLGGQSVPVFPGSHRDFPHETRHFHIDVRFLSEDQEDQLAKMWPVFCENFPKGEDSPFFHSKHSPGMRVALNLGVELASWAEDTKEIPQPFICRFERVEWDMPSRDAFWPMRYFQKLPPDPTLKVRIDEDGRPRCPHQGVDLTAAWDGESEIVRCPMHGMKVDMSRCRKTE